MRLHNVSYLLKEGGRNIFSNKLMSFACIGVLVACFLLIGSAVLISLTMNNIVRYVENQNVFVAFLEDDVTDDDISVINLALNGIDNILDMDFISKDEALQNERLNAGDKASLWDGLEDSNPYPHTYNIRVKNLELLDETISQVKAIRGVEKINSATEVADFLVGVRTTVNYAGLGIVVILIAVSIVIITNTIKLTVFSRRKEINIMKYVGATDSFIRMPFLVEGMLIGLLAAVFAFIILGFAYTYLLQWVGDNYSGMISIFLSSAVNFRDVSLFIFAGFAVIGMFIGTMGSGMFVRRYLKV